MAVGPLDSTSWERKDGRKVCTATIGYAVSGYASGRIYVSVCTRLNIRTYMCVCMCIYKCLLLNVYSSMRVHKCTVSRYG